MTKLPLTLMRWNRDIKHQCTDCLYMGIKNLTELSLMFISGLVVVSLLGIAVCTEGITSGCSPWPQKGLHSNSLLSNLLRVQSTEYSLPSEYNPHILPLMPLPARHKQGKKFSLFDKKEVVIWTPYPALVTIHWYCFLNRVRQSKTKQADTCDKDSVQGSNLLQLLTIFNLI